MPSETHLNLIYIGATDEVVLPAVPGARFARHGDPIPVPARLARELVARGDFIEFVPEPPVRPVQKHNPSKE